MKKIIISSVMLLTFTLHINLHAQGKDSFFDDYKSTSLNDRDYKYNEITTDVNAGTNRAPLGAGLLILGTLALGYAALKNN